MDLNLMPEVGVDTYTNVIIAILTFTRSSRACLLFTTPTYMVGYPGIEPGMSKTADLQSAASP